MKKMLQGLVCGALVFCSIFSMNVKADEKDSQVLINELDSENDWVEIINTGEMPVDISGMYITDDKGVERLENDEDGNPQINAVPSPTILNPGEVYVLEKDVHFMFGLGKADTVTLYNVDDENLDQFSWQQRSNGTYGRLPNGTGNFLDLMPTKGMDNVEEYKEEPTNTVGGLLINEINSSPDDWVEFINISDDAIDISGFEVRDDSDDHRWQFPDNTLVEAGEIIVVDANSIGKVYNDQLNAYVEGQFSEALGIGSGDAIRLYNSTNEKIDEYAWYNGHASYEGDAALASFGRYPDGTGAFVLTKETKGSANQWHKPNVVINEVESNDDVTDWVEIYNNSSNAIDISGWYVLDNDEVGHKSETTPIAEGTVLEAGELYVFDQPKDFSFGLGKADSVTIFAKGGAIVDTFTWTLPANGVYARVPDGTGALIDIDYATKGKLNVDTNKVILSEVQVAGSQVWIELANPTNELLDISNLVIVDSEKNEYTVGSGVTINPLEYMVITQEQLGFNLDEIDGLSIFDGEYLIQTLSWQEATNPSLAIYPDLNGSLYKTTSVATPGAKNKFSDIPDKIQWNGSNEVVSSQLTFLSDASGLDFYQDKLYAVDNGEGRFWIVDVDPSNGQLSIAKGFESGKRVYFAKDANNQSVAGPDTEGITVDGSGMVYLASERDNSNKGVNFNSILMVDPNVESEDLVAIEEWDLTASLPQVSANMGVEAVEWVSNHSLSAKLIDQNTGEIYDASNYPNAIADGLFFVALEDNGHVYAYILNDDGSSIQISDIDSKIGGAMALDYDVLEDVLWVKADNGYGNLSAMITLNGTIDPKIVHVLPPEGLDAGANNEGFAIATQLHSLTMNANAINNVRAVYYFEDGITEGSLKIGNINANYAQSSTDVVEPPVVEPSAPLQETTQKPPLTGDTTNKIVYFILLMLSSFMVVRIACIRGNRRSL